MKNNMPLFHHHEPGRNGSGARIEPMDVVGGSRDVVSPGSARPVLITGGAGFIGTNLADQLLKLGRSVCLFDNLSRPGVEKNVRWLAATHDERLRVEVGDLRDARGLSALVKELQPSAVYNFAAQVAVTTSLRDPVQDFEVNARGTLNLLEALRALRKCPPLLFTSTNKVYGNLCGIHLHESPERYEPTNLALRQWGISEKSPLEFHSPYGCSKGAGEQYVLDYAHTFGLPTVVFRMSCIYGPHQCGTEDQGWVAHFLIRALRGEPITIFGNGKQVRDILYVDDLVRALLLAEQQAERLRGQAFNIGGGAENTVSLLELARVMAQIFDHRPQLLFEPWRPADQRYYVSDVRRFSRATGWSPRVKVQQGVRQLHEWLRDARLGSAEEGVARPEVERSGVLIAGR